VDLYGSTGKFDVIAITSIRERHPERDPSSGWVEHRLHPHHRTTRRIEIGTCYLWDHRNELSDLVDVWEAGNRDDLFSVTSLKHFPYVVNSDFHKPKHLYSWKNARPLREELAGGEAGTARQRRHCAHAVPTRILGSGLTWH